MVESAVFVWVVLAALSLMFVAQYGRQIKNEPDDQPSDAGPMPVYRRSTGAIGSVVEILFRGTQRTAGYVFGMTRLALVAFGLVGFGIIYILVGLLQLDPAAWFYVGVSVVSTMEVFGVGLVSDPVIAFGAVGVLFVAVVAIRWYAFSVLSDD